MTTPTTNTSTSYLKNLFFADKATIKCNDDTISYYRSMDQPFTWEVFNINAFLSSYDKFTYENIQVSPNPINIFLINLLKTLNTIVFDNYSQSLFKDKFHQHLKTLMELIYISDVRPSADDADLVSDCVHIYPECISILGDRQTEELCKIAVTEDTWCIEHVREQTKEICDIVLELKPAAIRYIRNPTIEQYVTALCNEPVCSSVIPDRYLVHIVDSLSSYGKISLLTNFTGGRHESGSSLQADKLKTLRKEWRATNMHPTKQ